MGKNIFKEYLRSQGFRQSARRDLIVETFLTTKGHRTVETLLTEVRERDPRVGMATVYRTLKLLTRCGLAVERKFNRQSSRFEPVPKGKHHDHLICLGCGKIFEFENSAIETLQELVARDFGFRISHHVMELYGTCSHCQGRGRQDGPP